MTVAIRGARPDELDRIRELEDLAGQRYAEAGLPADLEGLSRAEVLQASTEDLLWVIAHQDRPVGFALCWARPGALHLREIDVHPDWMGRGLGKRLVEHVVEQAERRGLYQVTLTTFRDVPWNAPLYRRLGFVDLALTETPAWLRAIREHEDRGELSRWPRLAMVRRLERALPSRP